MIEKYSKNSKPFIYTAFPAETENFVMQILQKLSDDGVNLWFSDSFNRKEKKRLEGAFGVLLFANDSFTRDRRFHEIVDDAVKFGKNILCIYLDRVEMTPWMNMQLGSQLALFKDNFESTEQIVKKVKEAQIFQNMTVTDAQKRFQRNRGVAVITVPILAAVILFFAVVNPLLIEPARKTNNVIERFGLSKTDLESVTEIHIIGNNTFDTYVHAWYDDNNHNMIDYDKDINGVMTRQEPVASGTLTSEDLAILTEMPNLNVLEIQGQQITDLSYLPKLDVSSVRLNCNPIKSLEGIEKLQHLNFISIADTYVSDISPLLQLKEIRHIQLNGCPVSDLSGIENVENLESLMISDTQVRIIPQLGQIENLTLDVRNLHINDWSFISNVKSINTLQINNMEDSMRPDQVVPYIKEKPIYQLAWCGVHSIDDLDGITIIEGGRLELPNSYLSSLEGIEKFEGISALSLFHHEGDAITFSDLTPILKVKSLELLELSPDMQSMAEQQLKDAHFKIEYKWG